MNRTRRRLLGEHVGDYQTRRRRTQQHAESRIITWIPGGGFRQTEHRRELEADVAPGSGSIDRQYGGRRCRREQDPPIAGVGAPRSETHIGSCGLYRDARNSLNHKGGLTSYSWQYSFDPLVTMSGSRRRRREVDPVSASVASDSFARTGIKSKKQLTMCKLKVGHQRVDPQPCMRRADRRRQRHDVVGAHTCATVGAHRTSSQSYALIRALQPDI